MANGYFPGKKPAKRSAIITPRTAQELQIAAMPRMSRQARQALHDVPPLRVGGADLVEGADRIMRTPAEHQAALKVARVYLRVSTDEQNLERQEAIIAATRAAGFYVAGIYREKASGARADRPELERMIHDLQPGEAVVAEKIDRLSRLPLEEAERLVASIQAKGARLAIPGVIDLSDIAQEADGVAKIVLRPCRASCCGWPCRWPVMTMRTGVNGNDRVSSWPRPRASTVAGVPIKRSMPRWSRCANRATASARPPSWRGAALHR